MKDNVTEYASAIAIELVKRDTDPNELAKVATYLRTHLDGAQFFQFLDTMVKDGRNLVRTGRTLDYYRDISSVCRQHLEAYRNAKDAEAQKLAQTLGWAVRLMRYYKTVGVPPSASPTPRESTSLPSAEPLRHSPQRGPKEHLGTTPAVATTDRELVTLLEDAKRGKAPVQTQEGEMIVCTGFLPIPIARQGMRCRADVTRQGGKAQRAIFKRWE